MQTCYTLHPVTSIRPQPLPSINSKRYVQSSKKEQSFGGVQETYGKLQHELAGAEEKLRKALQQGKLLDGERKVLDKGIAKATNSIKVTAALICLL